MSFRLGCSGNLKSVCFSYRLEPKRQISIESDQWEAVWKDAWSFPIYDGWIGKEDVAGMGDMIPLHMIPDAVDDDLNHKLEDGKPAAQSAPAYVLKKDLMSFVDWLKNPPKSRSGKRRSGAGRPKKHDYTEIDAILYKKLQDTGLKSFESLSDVIRFIELNLGSVNTPPDSTLRNHINSWLKNR